ncbi:signal peptide peptidase SppA [Sphingomonas montana]|uniref:signal peptide peptidase SppA n=1 Tax=Sphingomonas montana TaxID=1843236 RepID=UPI00096EB7FE|nr:signal peptide peptidase SppA [Sphingomonas montana]
MRILRGFWKLLVAIKDGLVLLLMLLFFGALFAALSVGGNPRVPATGAMVLALDGSLVEQPSDADPFAAIAGAAPVTREYRLRDVARAVDGAASDANVKGVVLDLDRFVGGGQAGLATLGEAMDRVRRAGKPVLVYATGYTDDSYLLAAHASEVWLNPVGAVLLTGPGGSRLYYKGLLDKIGVTPKVYRVGEFKSAVEPFTRTDQSPAARAANQLLADALWADWNQNVAQARPKAQLASYLARPEQIAATTGGDMATAAVRAGLVDRLGNRIAFGRRVAQVTGAGIGSMGIAGSYQAIPFEGWVAGHPERSSGTPIGVVTVAGEIVDGKAGPGTAAGTTIADLILKELAKGRIKALVVRVDSPGGSVTASEQIRQAILEAKRRKLPVVISMGNVAASGGYWIATPGSRIFAEPSTITGSIGVFGIIPTFQGTLTKLGLSADGVATTPLSGQPDVLRGTSPQFDRLIQLGIEDAYRRFTGLVARSRGLPQARVDQIGQGRVWPGGIARQIGLVDQFGGLDDAIAYAARAAKVAPADAYPLFIEREPNAFKQFATDMFRNDGSPGDQAATDPWSRLAGNPERLMGQALGDARRIANGPAIQVRCLECPVARTTPPPRDGALARLILTRLGL